LQSMPPPTSPWEQPSAATAANRSSRGTPESGQTGRRCRRQIQLRPVRHPPPTIGGASADGLMGPSKFRLRSRRPVGGSAAKSKIQPLANTGTSAREPREPTGITAMAVSIDLCSPNSLPDQRFSGAGPSRCPVAGGRRRYRRPGRAGADLTNNSLVLARSEFHPRVDAGPPSPNDGPIVVRADFGYAMHQNGIADEDIAIRIRVMVDDRIGGPIVIGMFPPGSNIIDRREQRRLMPVPIVMMPMMPMAAPTRLRARR
jgi:hypothetical protein